jgi:serine/threonine protein kinase
LPPVMFDISVLECGTDNDKAIIFYNSNPQIYDSGSKITLYYERNEDEPDAIENKLLDASVETGSKNEAIIDVMEDILPLIPHFYPTATKIMLKTVGGKLTPTFGEDIDEIEDYPSIPPHLSHIPVMPITELKNVKGGFEFHRVKWKGKTYAFKTVDFLEDTLRELTLLDKLSDSPNIIDVKAIVVNRDNNIQGFLCPFIHAGDIENVFDMARAKRHGTTTALFDWQLKLSWACQIGRGLVDLHSHSVFNGDLKPRNVLIGRGGQVKLTNVRSTHVMEPYAAPEIQKKGHNGMIDWEVVHTAPVDIYAFGVLLHMVAEEKFKDVHPIVWREGKTSLWYRNIVEKCLALDPSIRPSATEVLSLLENGQES